MDAARYPEYRKPKMPWLPEVPAHWVEQRTKVFFREIDERSHNGSEELLSVSHLTGVTPRSQKNVTMFKAESYVGHKLCRPSDIVVNTLWAWMAALGAARHTGLVSPAYGVYRPHCADSFNPAYLDYLLRTRAYVSEYNCRSTGIRASRLRLYPNQFLDIPLIQPTRPEQDQIVAYLRVQDAHIARFIKAKRELISLLNESRQLLITQAVTRSQELDSSLQPSGIPWLCEIPTHWTATRIKNLSSGAARSFVDGDWIEIPYITDKGIRLIQTGNIKVGRFKDQGFRYISEQSFRDLKCTGIDPGDVLICRLGDPVARACIAPDLGCQMITSVDVCILKTADHVVPQFIVHILSSSPFLKWVGSLVRGSTRDRVSRSMLGSFSVPLPPYEEQVSICKTLDSDLVQVDQAIDEAMKEIDLVREYRDRLIADVVTGQIDVRNWVPGPDDEVADEDLAALAEDDNENIEEDESDGAD